MIGRIAKNSNGWMRRVRARPQYHSRHLVVGRFKAMVEGLSSRFKAWFEKSKNAASANSCKIELIAWRSRSISPPVIVGNSIQLASEVESGDALG